MGYCIRQTDSQVSIPKAKHRSALRALQDLACSPGDLTWIDKTRLSLAGCLRVALDECGFHVEAHRSACESCGGQTDDDITDVTFHGEKSGSEQEIFEALAPFVDKGSYIEWLGEDGDRWRWDFDGKRLKVRKGTVSWR